MTWPAAPPPRAHLSHALSLCAAFAASACTPSAPSTPPSAKRSNDGRTAPPSQTHATIDQAPDATAVYACAAPKMAGLLPHVHTGGTSYLENAPATVLITTRWGQGSGVIIDPSGLVLTNYHVVAGGEREDFDIEVGVTTANLAKSGGVTPGKQLRAVALRADPDRDLALLQIENPPAGLPSATLAPADRPLPGRKVSSIGNAGVGLGWAIKSCTISAIGSLEDAVETLFVGQAKVLSEDRREAMLRARKEAAKRAGRLIQTDCTVLPGDSGGPLIDDETHEVVGLNAAIRSSQVGNRDVGSVAFHIHVSELRSFVHSVPKEPVRLAPDPWRLAAGQAELNDTTQDGEVDTLIVAGTCGSEQLPCRAVFIDLNQDSFPSKEALPDLGTIFSARALDAELALFLRPRRPRSRQIESAGAATAALTPVTDQLLYVDSDDDGRFDVLLVTDGETTATRGYRLDGLTPTRDEELDPLVKRPQELFAGAERREDLAHFFNGPNHEPHKTRLAHTRALSLKLSDLDGDGRDDSVDVQTRLDRRIFLDLDQNALAGQTSDGLTQALAKGMIDAEVVAIVGTPYLVYYDTDDDGRVDLVLKGASARHGYALDAATLAPRGGLTPAPEHIGRRLLRPDLMQSPPLVASAHAMMKVGFPLPHAEPDDALGSFPSPKPGPKFDLTQIPSTPELLLVTEPGRQMFLVDLDRDTAKQAGNRGRALRDVVAAGEYDAEFILISDGTLTWAYYDTDGDRRFDQIRVASAAAPGDVRHVFTLSNRVKHRPPAKGESMFDPTVFRSSRLRRAFVRFQRKLTGVPG